MPGIRRLVQLFYRRKFTILLPALAMTGIAWAITSILVPRYAATAAITLNVSKVNLVDRELVSRLPLENSTLRSEIDVMRSRSLNDQVATSLALASDPEALREAAAWESPWPHISRRIRDRIARLLPGIVEKTPPEPPQLSAVQLTNWLVGNLGV
ncbi:MAG TPA: Wzz/FepE/Etk N-terminal domain-containing protein, partial [Stellaceae bacterium]